MNDNLLIIPARMNSSRLPKKLSLDLGGQPVLARTLNQALKTTAFDQIILATDSPHLASIGQKMGIRVMMTPVDCANGSERCAFVLKQDVCAENIVVLQGDEPFIDPRLLDSLSMALEREPGEMVSAMHPILSWDVFNDPSVIKVICDHSDHAIYFSRSPIPYINRKTTFKPPAKTLWGHIGVYGYKRSALIAYPNLHVPQIEEEESLEQLRAIHSGWKIKMIQWPKPLPGINTHSDLIAARKALKERAI